MTEELSVYESKEIEQSSPMALAQQFLTNGGSLESLEKMMVLQERFETNQAKKAYHVAMAAFKANPPKIIKDKKVAFGNTKYSHATLATIVEDISKALSGHGLSAAWKTNQNELIEVTCTITHSLGYSESTTLKAGPDASGGKNSIQAIGSTVSYLERYTILALTGLATHDQDDDGNSATPQAAKKKIITIGKENVNWLMGFCKRHKILTPKEKEELQINYAFDPYGTTQEEFEKIVVSIKSDFGEKE